MSSLAVEVQGPRGKSVKVSDEGLAADLVDGRTIVAPLAWFPRLWHGTPQECNHFEIFGDGAYIHWPDLDEDLTVAGLLAGQPWAKALLVPGNFQAQTLDRAKVPTVLGHQGNVDQDIAIDQVGHVTWWRKLSASKITSKTVDVFHAVDDVAPVFPYAVECEIPNRAGFALEAVSTRRYANLNNRPFDDAHILEGLEDAIFILCGDGHRLATGTLGQVDSRRYRIPYNIITPKMTAFGFLKCAAKCVTLSSFQL